jgi:hypothetical protein
LCSEYTISKNCGNIAFGSIKKFKSGVAMSFVILRTSKLKTAGEIGGSLGHTFRIMKTPNADKTKLHLNEHEFSLDQIKQNIKDRLPEKVRKNGVRVVEYLITASPDWTGWGTEKEKEFFDNAKQWLRDKHGSENVAGLSIHRDETTPHLVAYVVPIDPKGHLNARHFLGGKSKMSAIQSDFADQVKDLGLQRGLEGSKARHTTVKEFYAELQKPISKKNVKSHKLKPFNAELPKPKFLEKNEMYAARVLELAYEDAKKQVDQISEYYLNQIQEMHNKYESFKRIEMNKHEVDKAARNRAQDAALKLSKSADDLKKENFDRVIASAELTYSRIKAIEDKYSIYERFERFYPDDAVRLKQQLETRLYAHPDCSDIREKDWALKDIERELDDIRANGRKGFSYNELSHEEDLRSYAEREQELRHQIELESELWNQKQNEQELRHSKELENARQRVIEREKELEQQRRLQHAKDQNIQARHSNELKSQDTDNDFSM